MNNRHIRTGTILYCLNSLFSRHNNDCIVNGVLQRG